MAESRYADTGARAEAGAGGTRARRPAQARARAREGAARAAPAPRPCASSSACSCPPRAFRAASRSRVAPPPSRTSRRSSRARAERDGVGPSTRRAGVQSGALWREPHAGVRERVEHRRAHGLSERRVGAVADVAVADVVREHEDDVRRRPRGGRVPRAERLRRHRRGGSLARARRGASAAHSSAAPAGARRRRGGRDRAESVSIQEMRTRFS